MAGQLAVAVPSSLDKRARLSQLDLACSKGTCSDYASAPDPPDLSLRRIYARKLTVVSPKRRRLATKTQECR